MNTLVYWAARKAESFATALQQRGLVASGSAVVRKHIRIERSVVAQIPGKRGCKLLNVNWRLNPAEVKYVMNNSQAAAFNCDDAQPKGRLLLSQANAPGRTSRWILMRLSILGPPQKTIDKPERRPSGRAAVVLGRLVSHLYTLRRTPGSETTRSQHGKVPVLQVSIVKNLMANLEQQICEEEH